MIPAARRRFAESARQLRRPIIQKTRHGLNLNAVRFGGAVHELAKVPDVTRQQVCRPACQRRLKDRLILAGEHGQLRHGTVVGRYPQCWPYLLQSAYQPRKFALQVSARLLQRIVAGEQLPIVPDAQFDDQRRFSIGVMGCGKQHVCIKKNSYHLRPVMALMIRCLSRSGS